MPLIQLGTLFLLPGGPLTAPHTSLVPPYPHPQLGHPIQSSILSPTLNNCPHLGTDQISGPRDPTFLTYTPLEDSPINIYISQAQDTPYCLRSLPPTSRTHLSHGDTFFSCQSFTQALIHNPLSFWDHLPPGAAPPDWLQRLLPLSESSPRPHYLVPTLPAPPPCTLNHPSPSRVWQQVWGQGLATWTAAPLWFLGALPGWPQGGSY